jgi:hypothetical protein
MPQAWPRFDRGASAVHLSRGEYAYLAQVESTSLAAKIGLTVLAPAPADHGVGGPRAVRRQEA